MQEPAHTIAMDEGAARRIVLVQAVETGDPQGRLVTMAQRAQADHEAAEIARQRDQGAGVAAIALFLKTRAALVLRILEGRDPALASLQAQGAGRQWMSAAIPLGALLLGIFTDQVANPHQVNLLSKPLLLLLLWNAVVYLLLLVNVATGKRSAARQPRFAALRQWLAGLGNWRRRRGHLRTDVTVSFLMRWHSLTAGLAGQRVTRVMHLAAAAWALGVALSLFFGGVWASYGVQWESTFLNAADVHIFLSVLFKPVTALFPWASFSLEEVRSLRAAGPMPSPRDAIDNFTGRRWVFLYAMLLALGIVLPRLLLAAIAWGRERGLARNVRLDLDDGYFRRLVAALSPAQVHLCLYAQRGEDRAALLRVVLHRVDGSLPGIGLGRGETHELMKGAAGEVLRLSDLQNVANAALLPVPRGADAGWAGRLRDTVFGRLPEPPAPVDAALRSARDDSDVVLHVVSDAADPVAAAQLLQWLGKPVLVLVNSGGAATTHAGWAEQYRAALPGSDAPAAVLGFDQFARCWTQERVLLDAIGRCLPSYKAAGYARLATAWDERNLAHLRQSMALIGTHVLAAARQSEDVGTAPRSLVSLVSPSERDAHQRRSREAMAAVVERLQRSEAEATAGLLVLHGAAPSAAGALNHRLEERFVVQDAISATQAGIAGAASGAAMGVTIDLLTAGLTLGLAAAAGAVVGGGSAWVAAMWKNKATPGGTSVVQLGDAMMQALVEAALLRYLAVIHLGRGAAGDVAGDIRPEWRSEVVAAVAGRNEDLKQQWSAARSGQDVMEPAAALVAMLESISLELLRRLYPPPQA